MPRSVSDLHINLVRHRHACQSEQSKNRMRPTAYIALFTFALRSIIFSSRFHRGRLNRGVSFLLTRSWGRQYSE